MFTSYIAQVAFLTIFIMKNIFSFSSQRIRVLLTIVNNVLFYFFYQNDNNFSKRHYEINLKIVFGGRKKGRFSLVLNISKIYYLKFPNNLNRIKNNKRENLKQADI